MVFTFGQIWATLRVRDIYFIIGTVYVEIGDSTGEINTGGLKYANDQMFSYLQIYGAFGDGGAAIKQNRYR